MKKRLCECPLSCHRNERTKALLTNLCRATIRFCGRVIMPQMTNNCKFMLSSTSIRSREKHLWLVLKRSRSTEITLFTVILLGRLRSCNRYCQSSIYSPVCEQSPALIILRDVTVLCHLLYSVLGQFPARVQSRIESSVL